MKNVTTLQVKLKIDIISLLSDHVSSVMLQ